jgi:choline dehydrogenase-like flavoprotein
MAERGFDVVIIGSGPGGGATAWALTRRGVKVAVLEAGPAYDYLTDYRLHVNDWEHSRFPSRGREHESYVVAPLQKLDPRRRDLGTWNHIRGALNKSNRRRASRYHHVQGVGGTTLHYLGEAHRLHPEAMRMGSRFGVAADWPFDYGELEPYYLEAERVIGAAGPNRESARWRSQPYPLPAHRLSYASEQVGTGCRKLGLTLAPNSLGILSEAYDGRPPCNYCANCFRGCPRADKASVDVTFMAKALASGHCTLKTQSQVTRLEAGPDDRVAKVVYQDQEGRTQSVSGRAVVVSCGAVHTPRLLLASAGRHAPGGLANESGLVGRNFMETHYFASSGLHGEALGSHRGVPADGICWDFNAPDAIAGVVGGCRFTSGAPQAGLMGPIAYATRVVDGWGRAHKAAMRSTFGRALTVFGIGESLPNSKSYIDLDPDKTDRRGMALARIHSHLEDMDIRRLAFMAKTVREILRASGVEAFFEEYGTYDFFSSTHVFGTCRMGRDPEDSVVDPFGRSHRWRNLFVVDGSVFPSSGGGEAPSLTIEALAIRTAGHLREVLHGGDL